MGYWRTELERFKLHIQKRPVESFFIGTTENSREMKTTYASMKSIAQFIEYLEARADEEDAGYFSAGSVFRTIGGS